MSSEITPFAPGTDLLQEIFAHKRTEVLARAAQDQANRSDIYAYAISQLAAPRPPVVRPRDPNDPFSK